MPIWQRSIEAYPKKNILTPIGALAVGIFGISVAGAVKVWPALLSWFLLAIGLIVVLVALWAYIYFAVKDPDRLQTEDYRIQRAVVEKMPRIVELAPGNAAPRGEKLVSPPDSRGEQ